MSGYMFTKWLKIGTIERGKLGRVAEWSKATVLKTVVPETVPGVRIPPLPQQSGGREQTNCLVCERDTKGISLLINSRARRGIPPLPQRIFLNTTEKGVCTTFIANFFNNMLMKGYITDIEQATEENTDFRRVLYTAPGMQLVLMSLKPGEEIGEETHDLDQFIRVEEGKGTVILEGEEHVIEDDYAVIIPRGTRHNVINIGEEDLKLYTIYAPPEHKDGTVHVTKEEAMEQEEHFDGVTTEQQSA
jgi:mannose-6-phosphate isomerase-like protein (cupin superfamily)